MEKTLSNYSEAKGTSTKNKLLQLIKEGQIDTVILGFCDMQGRFMGKRVTGTYCLENDLDTGTHFCNYLLGTDFEMSVPEGYESMNWNDGYGDWIAKPDWDTFKVIPWLEKTASIFCDVYEMDGTTPVAVAPRNILKSQLKKAAQMGFQPYMASELEFYLFTETYETAHEKEYRSLQTAGHVNEDYNLLQGTRNEPLYQKIRQYMDKAGIPIESSKGEAYYGQHEINLKYADALKAADQHLFFKHGMKEICIQNERSVTFMSKPHHEWTGSSGHIHLSLTNIHTGKNVFFAGEDASSSMSKTMQHFMAGVLSYTRDFSLFFAPNVNSFKRFSPNSWAPVNIVWSKDNRSAGYRVVGNDNHLRFESRIPGADMNPYLAYSALIGAGLLGIEQELELSPEFKGNAYADPNVKRIPSSLHEAIMCWENSGVISKVLGDKVAKHYLHAATVEQQAFDRFVSNWEIARYFEQC